MHTSGTKYNGRHILLILCLTLNQQRCFAIETDHNGCDDSISGYLECDQPTSDWLLRNGVWAGNVSGTILVAICPPGYCNYNMSGEYLRIPSSTKDMGAYACNTTHRMGVACGACQQRYAPAFNSDTIDCVPCDSKSSKVNWIYYILSVYLPLFVVFLIIIVCNIRLTTGPLNAFILYAQVISSTLAINGDGTAPLAALFANPIPIQRVYQALYGPFNLNVVGNLIHLCCLSTNLTSLDVLALKYLEALFPLVMIMAIVILVKLSSCLQTDCKCHQTCKVRTSMVHAFAAFVLLSYNRFCQVTIYLITPVPLWNAYDENVEDRVYYYGDFQYSGNTYSEGYKMPAGMVMVLLIMLPIALLHYPLRWLETLISKVEWLYRMYPAASIAILLDTFQGCFNDNRRYFAGLYLAFRLTFLVAYTQPILQQYLFQQIFITSFILLLAVLKPYKNKALNSIDIAFFTNMALLNSLVWYTVVETDTTSGSLKACLVLECVLVFLPLAYIFCFTMWRCTSRFRCYSKIARCYGCCCISRRHQYVDIDLECTYDHRICTCVGDLLERSSDVTSVANDVDIARMYGIQQGD